MEALIAQAKAVLQDTRLFLGQVEAMVYRQPLDVFSGATLGQHTRHLLEFFQCLFAQAGAPGQCVNYDQRRRDHTLEDAPSLALAAAEKLEEQLGEIRGMNGQLRLAAEDLPPVITSFERELLYAIEHAIHHLAIIRIGLKMASPELALPDHFGVASSTIAYRARPIGANQGETH
jgi:hypothetical protein